MRTRIQLAGLVIAMLQVICVDATEKPNIVLFFVDDFGQRDVGCYGSSLYETPNMDQLAAQGMRFSNAYSAYPRCVPSRQGLLSGKYPCRVVAEADKANDRKHQLPLSEVTFGEALKEPGYRTCYIGKWHLGKEGGDPGAQGFDTTIHAGSAGATGDYFFPFPTEKGLSVVNPVDGKEGDYLTDRLTDEAVQYIADNKDGPFLLVMTMLQIAGAKLRPQQHIDGFSYLNALRGEDYQRAPMFWYKWQARPDSTGDTRAISYIEGNYKIIQWIDEDLVELFDLSQDVGEQESLAQKMPERTKSMLTQLLKLEQQVGDLREKGRKQLQQRAKRQAEKKQPKK